MQMRGVWNWKTHPFVVDAPHLHAGLRRDGLESRNVYAFLTMPRSLVVTKARI